jgi:class 3 adenylate cyclase
MPIFVSEENNDAEAMGTIIATIDMSEINQILRKSFVSTDFNESFLINKYHWIVSQSENKTNPSNAIPDTNPVANCFMYGENNYGKYENADNEKVYGFSYCINNFGIALLTEISGNKVLNPIINLQKTFFIVGITTVAGVVVVSFIVSTSISRPIMKLRDAADEIARGNFDVRSKIQSGDEIEQLSNSFDIMATKIQEYLEKIRQKDTVIKNQRELLLEFYESQRECCVGVIDIVNSTKITANLSDAETRNFYGTFINFMASIIMEFGATVVKNIGDAILFYFPHIDITDKHSFENVIDCCMQMIDAHKEINSKMDECGLSSFSYRISAVYGSVMVGHISTSSVADIFGSTVNACSKINRLALPNEFVIGQNLYDMVKSYGRFTFKYSTSYAIDDQTKLKVYSVKRQSMVQE